MKSENRSGHPRKEHAVQRSGKCIAMIDSHYMAWLLKQESEEDSDAVNRQALIPALSQALKSGGLNLDIQRVYWYTDAHEEQYISDQIVRLIGPDEGEGSDALLQVMSSDIKRLSENKACDHFLIASDDDRILGLVDEAQLRGIGVHLLADESARHMDQLASADPEWCRLLAQADRRIFLQTAGIRDLTHTVKATPAAAPTPAPPLDPETMRIKLLEIVGGWWSDEPQDIQDDLRDELLNNQGIPQEVDRHLLLRVRKALERPLSFPEKKMLREMVRNTVLGIQADSAMPAQVAPVDPESPVVHA
jgi:hypothetical protein